MPSYSPEGRCLVKVYITRDIFPKFLFHIGFLFVECIHLIQVVYNFSNGNVHPPQYCKSSNRSMRLSQVSILEMMPCRKCITLVISFWVMPASSRLLRMKAMMALYLLLWILLILEWFKSVTVWCYRPVTNTNLNIQTKYHTFRWNHFNIVVMPSTMYSFRLSHPAWKKSNLKKSGSSLLPLNVTLINSYLFQNFIFFFTELLCTHINTLPF